MCAELSISQRRVLARLGMIMTRVWRPVVPEISATLTWVPTRALAKLEARCDGIEATDGRRNWNQDLGLHLIFYFFEPSEFSNQELFDILVSCLRQVIENKGFPDFVERFRVEFPEVVQRAEQPAEQPDREGRVA